MVDVITIVIYAIVLVRRAYATFSRGEGRDDLVAQKKNKQRHRLTFGTTYCDDFSSFSAYLRKAWICFQCGKRYLWRGSLKNHIRVECGKEPAFKCPVCGRKFKHKHRWQSHAKCMHSIKL